MAPFGLLHSIANLICLPGISVIGKTSIARELGYLKKAIHGRINSIEATIKETYIHECRNREGRCDLPVKERTKLPRTLSTTGFCRLPILLTLRAVSPANAVSVVGQGLAKNGFAWKVAMLEIAVVAYCLKEPLENGQCSNMEEIEKGSEVSWARNVSLALPIVSGAW